MLIHTLNWKGQSSGTPKIKQSLHLKEILRPLLFQELYVALHVLKNAEMHINIDLTQKAMKQIKKRKTKQ